MQSDNYGQQMERVENSRITSKVEQPERRQEVLQKSLSMIHITLDGMEQSAHRPCCTSAKEPGGCRGFPCRQPARGFAAGTANVAV